MRLSVVALALLTALAAVVAGVPVTATGPSASAGDTGAIAVASADNSTNYLTLDPEPTRRVRVGAVSLDVAGDAAVDDAHIEARFLDDRIQERFETAPNETARHATIRDGVERMDDRIDRMKARERDARRAYNDGEWSTRAYLRELAILDATARQLQGTVEQLNSFNRAAGQPVDAERLARLKLALLLHQGPVRKQVAAAMTGSDGGSVGARVFVRSSETGTVLSTVDDGDVSTRYLRESYLGRDLTETDTARSEVSSIDEARERFLALYPWATDFDQYNIGLLTSPPYYLNAGVYALGVNHPQGTDRRFDLEAYLDADTGEVFREYQYVDVAAVRADRLATAESAGMAVTLEGTYVGGPLRVTAVDPETGEPVSATVAVEGLQIGQTGPDGVAAALVPDGEFSVTVTRGDETVTVEASLPPDAAVVTDPDGP